MYGTALSKLKHLRPEWRAKHSVDELRRPGATGGDWVDHSHPPIFTRRKYSDGTTSIVATAPNGDALVFRRLVGCVQPPYILLYLLYAPRGEAEAGRYLSESLDGEATNRVLDRFAAFLGGDGRHDFWLRSPSDNAMVVWDRHNLVHAYGPIDRYSEALTGLRFTEGEPQIPSPHAHEYREEFDADSRALLGAVRWHHTPLRPGDDE
jgi:hypothetical protein